ncbi:hypothetical protein QBC38DRAFT_442162 [Podospora fimiseda]|uniref:HMG box domain-containing protein n=1 Tax=Podospora fimiseda TaxID=252190 RepID=A0AAN7BT96_9PEZI|nr:hypothetical protein QBC38DRAFT_442162 [Podospora fimiseda]
MPRPPKNKAPEVPIAAPPAVMPVAPAILPVQLPPAQVPGGPPVIDVAQFIRVRDSVYQRLVTIQELIRSFSGDYLRQTNLLIGEATSLDNGADFQGQVDNLLPNFFAQPGAPQGPVVEEKKERKKRTHDPNAPKRPLTPYFLYMQTARPIIASDLGEGAPKGAVQEEGQRRWSVMDPAEKQGWNQAYQYNLRLYNARMQSYKAGNALAKNMTDEEARAYADQMNIEAPPATVDEAPADEQDAIAEQLEQIAPVEPSEVSDEEPAPVAKTPIKKKETRKRKSTAATPAVPEPEPPKPVATPASPEAKKRKRTSKAAEIVEEPKKSGRKKTKSS